MIISIMNKIINKNMNKCVVLLLTALINIMSHNSISKNFQASPKINLIHQVTDHLILFNNL